MSELRYRNLCVFIDGTGNSDFKTPAEDQTNVSRLWHACSHDSKNESTQRLYYKPGVGTRDNEGIWGMAAGRYLEDRVSESQSWLDNEVRLCEEDGFVPRIYIFGFSRGAYAARWLANKLNLEVEFLGVWDTVKTTLKGPDVSEASVKIKRIFHAIAIDEHRKLFDVTRFHNSPQAVEVWFPGCHADVGGGYKEYELATLSLNWIARHACRAGLMVDFSKLPAESRLNKMPIMHDEAKKIGWKIANFFKGNCYCNREIAMTDVMHPCVDVIKSFDYSPEYLPANYIVWNDNTAGSKANIA